MPNLVIPERFYVLHRKFLTDPVTLQRSDLADAVINIIGFVPFGFLVSLYLSQKASLSRAQTIHWALVLGGMTSFLIEFLQAYLPTRDSSYLDLINNILGTMVGALLVIRLSGYLKRFKLSPDAQFSTTTRQPPI
jgi:glycopeptide antibiotics resistance protein